MEMTDNALLQHIAADIRELRSDVRQVDARLDTFIKETEHRISKVEERAGIFGAIAGVLAAMGTFFGVRVFGP